MNSYVFDVFIIAILFALFGLSHSFLASLWVKKMLLSLLGSKMAFYRITYNIFSLISLFVIYQLSPKPSLKIYDLPNPFDLIILIPQFAGIAGFLWTLKFFDTKEFLGLNQIYRYFNDQYNSEELDERLTLRIEGPYRYSRHPVYLFSIMILIFRPVMDLFYLTILLCIITYFYIGSYFEEKKLREVFGEKYRNYQEKVPRIFPVRFYSPYIKPAENSSATD